MSDDDQHVAGGEGDVRSVQLVAENEVMLTTRHPPTILEVTYRFSRSQFSRFFRALLYTMCAMFVLGVAFGIVVLAISFISDDGPLRQVIDALWHGDVTRAIQVIREDPFPAFFPMIMIVPFVIGLWVLYAVEFGRHVLVLDASRGEMRTSSVLAMWRRFPLSRLTKWQFMTYLSLERKPYEIEFTWPPSRVPEDGRLPFVSLRFIGRYHPRGPERLVHVIGLVGIDLESCEILHRELTLFFEENGLAVTYLGESLYRLPDRGDA